MNIIKKILPKIGMDKAIAYTSLARIIQASGGFIILLFIASYLTSVEQGFYYTFGSIVAIQIFFELGLNGIITQYVAHETSHLSWNNNSLEGPSKYQSRLSSLLHFAIKWYLVFAILLFIILIVTGIIFFTKYQTSDAAVGWKAPWVLLAIGTATNLLIAPIMAFCEGLGKVKEVARIRFFQQTSSILILVIGLICGLKLYVLGLNSIFIGFFYFSMLVFTRFRKILKSIWQTTIFEKVNYKKEIFPYQWKIALSWISGYFIFQLFNPVLFATEGAIVAGQMGMTLSVLNGVQALSMSWMTTKVPLYSGLIAQKQYYELDTIFNRTLKQTTSINAILLIVVFITVFVLKYFNISKGNISMGSRFLDYIPMLLMMVPLLINQFIASWATYLRCHKKEPFLLTSIVAGILCCLSTLFLGKFAGVLGVTGGYCIITLFLLPWSYHIFKTKKIEWHGR